MKCTECAGTMDIQRQNRRYEAGGLSRVVLLNVEVRRCPSCGEEELIIPRIAELHRTIARALVAKPARLAPPEVRFLRKYLGWSSSDFAKQMGTVRETVSRWENGRTPIGSQADRLLRLLVDRNRPVENYEVDLSRIRGGASQPVRLHLRADKKGWHMEQAA